MADAGPGAPGGTGDRAGRAPDGATPDAGAPAGTPSGAHEPDPATTAAKPGARRRGRTAGLLVLAALLTAASSVPVWLRATGSSAVRGEVDVPVTGTQAAPAVLAAAVALLAAAAAVGLVGRVGRWVVAGVVAAAGATVVVSALTVLGDPQGAARTVVAAVTGVGALAGPATPTPWPVVAVVVGVLDLLAAAVVVVSSRRWAAPTARYGTAEARGRGTAAPPPGPDDDRSAWDALSRGDDPT
ncbi:Trp biosynthesis-associated membrane protein [Cellulomonas sp. NS3]|uniref:Trp biosynthesis-associated membrane protein n=1 Tax=Cellulomonas sp. NS3 TaxID=2973977 RepID=UPI002162A2CF|nr:Trp biosynthesis-associated membrane protein [Cellulomonas sp. NS3]